VVKPCNQRHPWFLTKEKKSRHFLATPSKIECSSLKKKRTAQSAFFNPRVFVTLLVCGAVCCIVTATLRAFFHSEAPAKGFPRTLTLATKERR
jgi:hypothetical protein